MTTSTGSPADQRVPIDSTRKTALVAGILYLVTFASSIPAFFLLEPVLSNPNYIIGPGADTQVALGAFLDLVNALAAIGTAVALFSVLKRQHEGFALGFVASRMFEGAVIAIGVVGILSVVTLRQDGAAGGDAASLVPIGQALVAVHDWAQILGPGMAGVNALLLGTLMYRSALVPRWIPALGLIGGPLYLSSVVGIIIGVTEPGSAWQAIGGAPMFVWELALGLCMTFKGFKPSPITTTSIPTVPTQTAVSVA
jgi:hypothetical protein